MDASLAQFNAAVDDFTDKLIPEQVMLVQKKMALETLRRIVMKTPVDTGRARGNWQTTIDTVPDAEKFSGNPVGDGANIITASQPFVAIYISNNLPYIERLEDGYSAQAPNGMVGLTIEELRTMFP